MSIEKRTTKQGVTTYSVRYRSGKSNRRRTFDRLRDAQDFEAKIRVAARQGELSALDAGKVTLEQFGEQWMQVYVESQLKERTQEGYESVWRLHVLPYIGDMQLREITPRVVERWRFELEGDGVGRQTVRKSMGVLQSCMERAYVWGEIAANPVKSVKKPNGKRTKKIRPVTPFEVESMRQFLLSQRTLRDATLFATLAYAGLRPGEALALTWESVRKNILMVEQAASLGKIKETKTGAIRSVKLLAPLREDLEAWRPHSHPTSNLVFASKRGEVWSSEAYKSWARHAFASAAESIGRPDVTPYTLRHSYASLLIQQGMQIIAVAGQLGHAPTMTLDTYGHEFSEFDPSERMTAEEAIEEARSRVHEAENHVPISYPRAIGR